MLKESDCSFSIGHFQVTLCVCFKASPRENEFDLYEIKPMGRSYFPVNGLARTKKRFDAEARNKSKMTSAFLST